MIASILLHVLAVLLVILLAPLRTNPDAFPPKERTVRPRIMLQPVPAPSKDGGGGSQSPRPPSRGRLLLARHQFTPPNLEPVNLAPKLAMEPTIVVETQTASLPDGPLGLPTGVPGPPSGGPGRRGGIGTGEEGGAGDGKGPTWGGVQPERLRADMNPPVVLTKMEPEYSEQARKARIQGTVIVEGVIDHRGHIVGMRVRDGLGFGLDEMAVEAVKQWRFRPATRDGKPVAIIGVFELNFRLL